MLAFVAVVAATRLAIADALPPAVAFREAAELCARDDGKLWGVSLCGPMLLVEPATRTVFANQVDKQNTLRREGEIFTGKLPNEINIANTAVDWAGVKWTMIMLPLPEAQPRRAALMAHEMWHRVQEQIGFPASGAANNHLDTRDGRYWLQLEWRALAAALGARGDDRNRATEAAALFRARRRQLFEKAATGERAMELHEGLAEYTGVTLSGHPDLPRFVIDGRLKEAPAAKTFVRSFAYANGPAYGLLLDAAHRDWKRTLGNGADLGDLLFTRLGSKVPTDVAPAAEERARIYGGAELAAAEDQREQERRELIATYRARLVDGPVLTIPLQNMQMQFNPGDLVALEPLGTIYPDIRIVDVWGVLTVSSGGALMSSDFSKISVTAPQNADSSEPSGDGWKVELKPGWSLAPAERDGSFTLVRKK
jgi:hypothetical protein